LTTFFPPVQEAGTPPPVQNIQQFQGMPKLPQIMIHLFQLESSKQILLEVFLGSHSTYF
jgi:hypothetical protein